MNVAVASLSLPVVGDHWKNTEATRTAIGEAAASADLVFALETPVGQPIATGRGVVLDLRGVCAHRSERIVGIDAWIDDRRVMLRHGEVRDDVAGGLANAGFRQSHHSGFNGHTLVHPRDAGSEPGLRFGVRLASGESCEIDSGVVEIVRQSDVLPVTAAKPAGEGPAICVAMAAYRPDIKAFEEQIESIRAQRVTRWHLVIRDDGSPDDEYAAMQAVVAGDSRITLLRNAKNLGFYRNFEAVLASVPPWADYVALSDQDDLWYPDKLDALLSAMPEDGCLAYSDMRIVDPGGEQISSTYWRERRNNYTDLDVVLLANTVTGAASMIRASLVDALLPFPEPAGDAFHDHWIALSAMVRGPLGYVDRALYDYRQHDTAVIGHSSFATPSAGERVRKLAVAPFRRAFWSNIRAKVVAIRRGALNIHRYECRRLERIARTLVQRYPGASGEHLRTLALFDGGLGSGIRLIVKHLSIVRRSASTNDAELRLGMGYIVHELERWRGWLFGRLGLSQ